MHLNSTNISGIILATLPIGHFLAMRRYDKGIVVEWCNLSGAINKVEYYDVLTGEQIDPKRVER